eukprot:CAMPEP_0172573648 /NCGR_PEP_ID=MMETSP1067-20121228/136297_1 /TAXON_ID=265564 ORGANISM="Thalassiosira punctigera, Strain Tpunct2005C2" /NCGR_SAMPLE_ID=MMETSP1067 /ASSEMBLY_ACC=CAM_ASM_000444 /LENGTH=380 /DNA_ID=CAMNT_0013366255 /DNA_START=53 /DNA_END=1191 /DNA_ORIENTATION=-
MTLPPRREDGKAESRTLASLIIFLLAFLPQQSIMRMQRTDLPADPILKTKRETKSSPAPCPRIFLRQSDPLPPHIDDTLRLVFLSDTHGRHDEIPLPLPDGDILFHLGDASDRGNISEMRSFVRWMKTNSFHKERVVIDGNHDRVFHLGDASDRGNISEMRSFVRWMKTNSFHKERVVIDGNHDRDLTLPGVGMRRKRDFMAEYEGVATVLRNEVVEVAEGKMAIVGVTWDACQSENFTEAKDNVRIWSESAGEEEKKVDLVLSHLPPYVKGEGRGWRGSGVLSHFVKNINPPLHCFGHIHCARGVRAFDSDIMMLNCASTWNIPVVVDYCPIRKRALMIHCPVPDDSVDDHLRSRKVPKECLVAGDELGIENRKSRIVR